MRLGFTILCASMIYSISAAFGPGCNETSIAITQDELQSILPPSPYWNDTKSIRDFVIADDVQYMTPVELSNFTQTATYAEVTDYFTKLASESPYVELKSIAKLPNGEDLWLVVVSGEEKFDSTDMKNPIVYATASIHAGESSGTNAGMMFVRNLVMNDKDDLHKKILESVNFLFVPVMNVYGYERQKENGRLNQHGPNTSGYRANGSWKNLNRDFSKLDEQETRAVVKVMTDYEVSFYTDMHSTDGMNYQPDVTWCDNGDAGLSPEIFKWLRAEMQPNLESFLEDYGHIPNVCYDANDKMDPTKGYYPYFSDGPVYSTNYADHRQIPSYLLEIHSLKPNKQRVLGAYAFLLGINSIVIERIDSLRTAIKADQAARIDPVPIAWEYDDPAPQVEWNIFEYEVVTNPVLGIQQMVWTDIPKTITVEQSTRSTPLNPVKRPVAYVIPAQWVHPIRVLADHGIKLESITSEVTLDVINYRAEEATISRLKEGRHEMNLNNLTAVACTRTYHMNDVLVKTDQPLGTLAVALLEPTGEGSFALWGMFSSILAEHNHFENYVMVPLAEKMLNSSSELNDEWEQYKLMNPTYVNDTETTLIWFWKRSAFYEEEAYVYPVGILYEEPSNKLPLAPFSLDSASNPDNVVEESNGGWAQLSSTLIYGIAVMLVVLF